MEQWFFDKSPKPWILNHFPVSAHGADEAVQSDRQDSRGQPETCLRRDWQIRNPTWRKRDPTWRKSYKIGEKVSFVGEKCFIRWVPAFYFEHWCAQMPAAAGLQRTLLGERPTSGILGHCYIAHIIHLLYSTPALPFSSAKFNFFFCCHSLCSWNTTDGRYIQQCAADEHYPHQRLFYLMTGGAATAARAGCT